MVPRFGAIAFDDDSHPPRAHEAEVTARQITRAGIVRPDYGEKGERANMEAPPRLVGSDASVRPVCVGAFGVTETVPTTG
jgi:hypothetical protein